MRANNNESGLVMATIPSVMVSSTFYDLSQERADLKRFIAGELGYEPLLSEYPSFPVDPDLDTIENCRRRVEQDADIFVLIIGGRYGSVDLDSDKSITNIEYVTARQKGIPIYAFVKKSILSIMPVWQNNKDGDFSNVVDDTRLFEFAETVREKHKAWTHDFEEVQDVIGTLRKQFAYLVGGMLQLRLKVKQTPKKELQGLTGEPLRLAIEKPFAWEARLFATVLIQEVEKAGDLRRAYHSGVAIGQGEWVDIPESGAWVRERLAELQRTVVSIEQLLNVEFQKAIGAAGEPGDVQEITFVAKKIGEVYREALRWSQRIRRARVHECFEPVLERLVRFPEDTVEKIETFGPEILPLIDQAEEDYHAGRKAVIKKTLTLDVRNVDDFTKTIEEATQDCIEQYAGR